MIIFLFFITIVKPENLTFLFIINIIITFSKGADTLVYQIHFNKIFIMIIISVSKTWLRYSKHSVQNQNKGRNFPPAYFFCLGKSYPIVSFDLSFCKVKREINNSFQAIFRSIYERSVYLRLNDGQIRLPAHFSMTCFISITVTFYNLFIKNRKQFIFLKKAKSSYVNRHFCLQKPF